MSAGPRFFAGHEVFPDAGPSSARRLFVDAADGWLSRRVGLELARSAGLSEAAVRGTLDSPYTTANATGYAVRHGMSLEQAILSPDLARINLGLVESRRDRDWAHLADYLEDLYDAEAFEDDDYAETA